MKELYNQAIENGRVVFHRKYCLYNNNNTVAFDAGAVRLICFNFDCNPDRAVVNIFFGDGSNSEWTTKWITPYHFQFGIAASIDGKYIFVQTWENGLFCLDSHTGEKLWRTKSKRGITDIFVNESTVLCHQRERALQLLDIHTGAVLTEKRPATAWGFTAIDHRYVVCQVTARRWEMIDATNLETKQVISHRDFTNGHENYCVNHIKRVGNEIVVQGFQNAWDNAVSPVIRLPDLEFEHSFLVDLND